MAEFEMQVGSRSVKGVRPNNEDALLVDLHRKIFLVADGMGGQERGEVASAMAVDLIPRLLHERLNGETPAQLAVAKAMEEANLAILEAGKGQPEGKRMGTTAVLALCQDRQLYVSHLGDSRAYLIRGDEIQRLTIDHSVAQALVEMGAITAEEGRSSPYQHVLHKFLGCANLPDGADVRPYSLEPGDWLLLGSDGLTNHIHDDDFRQGSKEFAHPQPWAEYLVDLALHRGSRDNVTCVIVHFTEA